MAVLYGTTQQGQLVPVEADSQGRLVAELATAGAQYQQGAWTPSINAGSFNAEPSTWWRIGNAVTVNSAISDLTDRSSLRISVTGLPYLALGAPANTAGYQGSLMAHMVADGKFTTFLDPGNQWIRFFSPSINSSSAWVAAAYDDLGAGNIFRFQVSYLTDDTTLVPINGATVNP